MKIDTGRVLDRLAAEEPCLGAFFTSYSFDPVFFEEHVLRAVLRLTSDPFEQADRYHHEARHALQKTPVVAIVDAGERRSGRRLPFDLLEVADTVFHPKSVLLLYQKFARLLIGSGNLTFSGYGGNTELFICVDLAYDRPADAALLATFDGHIERVRAMVRRPGTQLELFREELRRRIPQNAAADVEANLAFVDSITGPIIEQFASLLPANAVIESVGMLAPYFERDDTPETGIRNDQPEHDIRSVFGALSTRIAKTAVLDIGLAWDNPQVQATVRSDLEMGLGQLWTWAYEQDGERVLEHLVPKSIGPNTLSYVDDTGTTRRQPRRYVDEALEQRELWQQPPPVVFAPRNAVLAAQDHFSEVRMWLYPAIRLVEGRPVHRPLHAKLLVASYRAGQSTGTLVLVGSPNMSRRALLMKAGKGAGNVETAVAFRLNTGKSLRDLVPDLIYSPPSVLDLQERPFPELGRNYALAIEQAMHDPTERSLAVTWSDEADTLPEWCLTYDGRMLAASNEPPTSPVTVKEFSLTPATAEILLHVKGQEYSVPILVTDLVELPVTQAGETIGLEELLLLLSRRIGIEGVMQISKRRAYDTDDTDEPNTFLGDAVSPTDVFRAWWSVAEDLQDPVMSVQAFRLRLEGALGVGAAWKCMLNAVAQKTLTVEEVWFYGSELLRTLRGIKLPTADDVEAKHRVLSEFCDRVRGDLGGMGFEAGTRPWIKHILDFYMETA